MLTNLYDTTRTQRCLLLLLLVTGLFSMSLTADATIYSGEPIQHDPLYTLRAIIVAGGLISPFLSLALLLWHIERANDQCLDTFIFSNMLWHSSAVICSFCLGWGAFPYWASGAFQAYLGNGPEGPLIAFDPKRLMPAIWVGEVWYLGMICILVVAILLSMAIFVLSVCTLMINPRTWKECLLTMLCLAASASLFWLDDNYVTWFMD
jgi:hypothetical protein